MPRNPDSSGPTFYVNDLVANAPDELADIALYLNFDMVGSPNYGLFILDGDQSQFPAPVAVPPGSEAIEETFERYYAQRDIPSRPSEFNGRSDYQAFIVNGVPAGGLFTGAEGIKTEEQADLWGGTAGIAYDPCYHQACDTIDNVNHVALGINADAVAYAVLRFGMSTKSVNDVRPSGNTRVAAAEVAGDLAAS